ncbi:MAG TPA: PilZ domain-containing protein [bacterium]|nr:PilZ domain-containing protein [bacterium]
MTDNKKGQKRRFVRLNVVLPVKYRKYTGNPIFTSNFNVGRTIDLSSGGLKLSVSRPIPAGSKLDMEIELDEKTASYVAGKVLGGEDKVIDGIGRRIEKITFVDMDPEAQDLIMKFIFNNQRKQVRQGLKKPEVDHGKKR